MNTFDTDFDTSLNIIFEKILYNFSPKEIDVIKNTSKQDLCNFHFGLGLWLRNNILLNNNSICEIFEEQGISHWDDISGYVIEKFHEHLNK